MVTLGAVLAHLDGWFDPAYAESWDAVGLVTGDPTDPVARIHVAVDPTADVVAEATGLGVDLLLVHHPLFLRGVHGIPATTPGGRLVRSLIAAGCALHVAHTNADVARPGVNDALLAAVGVPGAGRVLRPSAPLALHGLVIHVPRTHAEAVRAAVTAAGAGRLGNYAEAAFAVDGAGSFRPLAGSSPHLGEIGELAGVEETRLELLVASDRVGAVIAALRSAHPYEEPSFWLWPLTVPSGRGLGRVGELAEPMSLGAFGSQVGTRLPRSAVGVRGTGDPDAVVHTVAVVGGSGADLAGAAAAAGADVLVTADVKHHAALDAPLPVLDVGHWASERPWCDQVAGQLRQVLGDAVTVTVSTVVTDPWSLHHCQDATGT